MENIKANKYLKRKHKYYKMYSTGEILEKYIEDYGYRDCDIDNFTNEILYVDRLHNKSTDILFSLSFIMLTCGALASLGTSILVGYLSNNVLVSLLTLLFTGFGSGTAGCFMFQFIGGILANKYQSKLDRIKDKYDNLKLIKV